MINLKQNGSGQNINLSPIYHQIEVLDENTVLLSRRIDTIQTGSVDLSEIENSISSLNNSMITVQTDLNSIKIDVNSLNSEIDSIKTNLTSIVSDVSMLSSELSNLSSNQINYYESNTNMITQRNFNYNFRDSNYETNTDFSVNNGLMNISSNSFNTPYMSFNCINNVKNSYSCSSNIILNCTNLSSCSITSPCININAYYANSNSIYGSSKIHVINESVLLHTNNSYSSFGNLNLYVGEKALSNTFSNILCLNLKGNTFWNDFFVSCEFINYNGQDIYKNYFKNVKYLNCIGKNFEHNSYINQSDYPYQCQIMNPRIMDNTFGYPELLNITCKMIDSNYIVNAGSVDVKCNYLIDNTFSNIVFLKLHNIKFGGSGFYSGIGDFYLENFSTKSTNESISNVTRFRFNNGSTNLYDTNLNWTLTNTNYDFVESNVVHCGDFNPIPYIRSINKHLESIETKLTQSTSPESDVFVKKINIPNNINGTTFTPTQSLKINCISVENFKCSDIKSLKINGENLESGMFSNIKSVEINALNCDELTFDNVEYIKVSCTNKPNIYCSNIGTVKLNNYDKIQLQKFNLFEAPHPNNYFYSCYMCNWNVNAPESNAYDAHFMTDYTYNNKSYATVKFKFNVDTFKQTYSFTTTQFNSTINVEGLTTNRLLFWKDNTFKLGNAVEYVQNNKFLETAGNVLMNYQIQFDMPYVTTFSNYQR